LAHAKKICGRSREDKNFAQLTQNLGIAMKMFCPSHVKPPVETGFTPSPESQQAAVSKGIQTHLYKVLQRLRNTILSLILGGTAIHRWREISLKLIADC
jgi:hypothetical protein